MEISSPIMTTQFAVPSPCGSFVATLNGTRFEVRRVSDLDILRSIDLTSKKRAPFLQIEWSTPLDGLSRSTRVLLADEDTVRIWDITDTQWSATIDNGSGGMGKNAHVEFGSSNSEVLVFPCFGARVAVWSLLTGKMVDIKNPKFTMTGHGRSRLGRRGTLAMLTRNVAQDVITLHATSTYDMLKAITVNTMDARGLKWSPDARWLAVWESPSIAFKVHIYAADGTLYRTYTGEWPDDTLAGLGARSLEWSRNSDFLAVGGFDHSATLLGTKTFSPSMQFTHSHSFFDHTAQIWQEQATAHDRSYAPLMQHVTLPAAVIPADDPKAKHGISVLAFNSDDTLLATRDDRLPTTVWIWDIGQKRLKTVLIQHALVKKIAWSPDDPNTLLIHCVQDDNILYLWHAMDGPRILDLSAHRFSGKTEVHWIQKNLSLDSTIMLASALECILVYSNGRKSLRRALSEFNPHRNAAILDVESDLDIDAGKLSPLSNDRVLQSLSPNTANNLPDDTFQYRKQLNFV